jgi:hypothetical protein
MADHPWADDGADVRMAVTVGASSDHFDPDAGALSVVTAEMPSDEGLPVVEMDERQGRIHADLTTGADVTAAEKLAANADLSSFGVMVSGRAFIVGSRGEAETLGLGTYAGSEEIIRPTLNGKDLANPPRERFILDTFGLEEDELREQHPAVYERLLRDVKPERAKKRRKAHRVYWWLHGEKRPSMRRALAGLDRYIATPETAKHRLFQFLPISVLPEHKIIAFGSDDAYHLGVLSSRIHTTWADAAGGNLGVGNDSVYNTTRCFQPFPFPAATPEQQTAIRTLGDAIDAHRKARQHEQPRLGLTDLYNAASAIRAGRVLTEREQKHATQGHGHTLADLHRRLDAAVLDAYAWSDLDPETPAFAQKLLARLVALNAQRAREESEGHVRYLRPAFQSPGAAQVGFVLPPEEYPVYEAATLRPWPTGQADQFVAVRQTVSALSTGTAADIASRFRGAGPKTVAPILDTLTSLGLLRHSAGNYAA